MFTFLKRIFGSSNDRAVAKYLSRVAEINALEASISGLSDADLKAQTNVLKQHLKDGQTLEQILPRAFAVVREAAKRTLRQRHFDVQLVGGMVLHDGKIAEMLTGEGKTLVSTLPAYLNALTEKGVHIVTVNDYLARRDAAWMGQIYQFLGLKVGCIVNGLTDTERKQQYAADITYGTNNEFGFDYLRDNMKFHIDHIVQRPFNFAIVDEVDSILIDEARTPLIISGPAQDSSELYRKVNQVIPKLKAEHFELDEKLRSVVLTDAGQEAVEAILNEMKLLAGGVLYDAANVNLVHHVNQALRAHKLFQKDRDYIIKDAKIIIIDEFTGRMMDGRRYGEGLHQAIEAKENVPVQNENQTLASITFQNYFRLYPKLSGMTGTAQTEAAEFGEIYKLEVVSIPPNIPVQRKDHEDKIFKTEAEKTQAIIQLIEDCIKRQQPVLVGTTSIEKSEVLSAALKKARIAHQVLNARYHEAEAFIVAQAGQPGAVTIATNMAGRGTDIQLGGNLTMRLAAEMQKRGQELTPEQRQQFTADIEQAKQLVLAAGGLYVIGTERHESRRIDNQLRGRSGRQGDPGASQFFLSLEDDLMRIFGSERIKSTLETLGLPDGEPIQHPWVSKALEKAQQKVEARNFDIRKQLLKFDDVMNDQRKVIYEQRRELIVAKDVRDSIIDMRQQMIDQMIAQSIPVNTYKEQWLPDVLNEQAKRLLALDVQAQDWFAEEGIAEAEVRQRLALMAEMHMQKKDERFGETVVRLAEKSILLQVLDQYWKEHLLALDHLRHGINLRAYAQQDPLNEYKREAFMMFEQMLQRIRQQTVHLVSHVEPILADPQEFLRNRQPQKMVAQHEQMTAAQADAAAAPKTLVKRKTAAGATVKIDPEDPRTWGRVARNSPCPCGSGKKYKYCHGLLKGSDE